METCLRIFAFILLIIFWFAPWVILGMFFWPLHGELYGLAVGAFLLLLAVLLSDNLMIFFTNPRRIGEKEKMMDFVKNLSFRMGIDKVGIYSTSRLPNNIYVMDNVFSRPRIIIGEGLINLLSYDELNSLIYYALFRVKSREAIFRTLVNFLLTVMFLPVLIFEKDDGRKSFLATLRFFLLSPLFFTKVFFFKRERNLQEEDQKFLQESGLRVPFASAIFKIGQLDTCERRDMASNFFENLVLADNQGEDLFQDFFEWGYDPNTRYQKLVKES